MKEDILIINASPRKSKNCFNITKDISKILEEYNIEYKVFNLYEMNIDYCNDCGVCRVKKGCRINDDMSDLYNMFNDSKGTIVVSPVYFNSVPAKMKTLIDRTQAIYSSKFILNDSIIDRSKKRASMYIAVGGSSEYENQFEGGDIVMDFFFKSINARSIKNIRIANSDENSYIDNNEIIEKIKINTKEYIEYIEKL